MSMETDAIILRAEDALGYGQPGSITPNRRYRNPRVAVERRSLATCVPAGAIRVEMLYAGVCGSDLHLCQCDATTGFVRTSAPAHIPADGRVIGHEGVGRIVATGCGVDWLHPGQVVAFASIIACQHCPICRSGAFNQCPNALLLGMEVDGLFAKLIDVPARLAHDVGHMTHSEADLQAAACLEPAAVALLACTNARITPGNRVVVFGGGPIGLFCAIAAKRVFGASHVTLVEPLAFRRAWSAPWCDSVWDVESFFADDRQFDVLLESSGCVDNLNRTFTRIAPLGRAILLGRGGEPLSIDAVDHMITNAVTVAGSRGHLGGALDQAMALHTAGLLPLGAATTRVLDTLPQLCAALNDSEMFDRNCKIIVRL